MGYGDELLGSGVARGAAARGKRIAFGDGKRIMWRNPHAQEIYQGNPNVAPPGSERAADLEWVQHYVGRRLYARPNAGRWLWDYSFKATPGEVFLTPAELAFASRIEPGFILIEPRTKASAQNKQWPVRRYEELARWLVYAGYKVMQPYHSALLAPGVTMLPQMAFRQMLAVLKQAQLYIGPEGGLHHGAAAVGTKAVVIFGGFISPKLTGYAMHTNLAVGEACGTYGRPCQHCAAAMAAISVDMVVASALTILKAREQVTA